MTVSRAINNHPNVSEQVRQMVLNRAADLGYAQSSAAKAIRGLKTGTIGLLLPNILNEFYAHFANTLASLCEGSRQNLVIHLTDDDPQKEYQAILRLREIHADAVIMVPANRLESSAPPTLPLKGMAILQLIRQREETEPLTSSLQIEDSDALAAAVDHLVAQGHKHIAYIGPSRHTSSGKARYEAFMTALRINNLDIVEDLVIASGASYQHGFDAASSLVAPGGKAGAIVCGGFEISRGALEAIMQSDLSMPEDIGFVGYGDPSVYTWLQGGVTTIQVPVDELARATYRALEETAPGSNSRISQSASLIIRHTT